MVNWFVNACWQCNHCGLWHIYGSAPGASRCCSKPVTYIGIWTGYEHVMCACSSGSIPSYSKPNRPIRKTGKRTLEQGLRAFKESMDGVTWQKSCRVMRK